VVISVSRTGEHKRRFGVLRCLLGGVAVAVRLVVGRRTTVAIKTHRAITLIVVDRATRRIDRKLLMVGADAVAMGIGVSEYPPLKHAIRRQADTRDDVARGKGSLFDLGEIVLRIAIQLDYPHFDQRKFLLRPDLGDVERIFGTAGRLRLAHHLDAELPPGELAPLDRMEKIPLRIIGIAAGKACCLARMQVSDPLHALEVELHPVPLAFTIDQAEGVTAEAVHEPITIGDATIGKQDGDLMQRLGRVRPEIPHHLRALQIAPWVTLLRMDEIRKFQRIADEEDRRVVTHQVPIAFLGIELHREAARITLGIRGAALTPYRGKAQEQGRLLANGLEQLGTGEVSYVCGHGKRAIGAGALGVHTTLRNDFAVEMGELFDQVEVIQQQRATRPG